MYSTINEQNYKLHKTVLRHPEHSHQFPLKRCGSAEGTETDRVV